MKKTMYLVTGEIFDGLQNPLAVFTDSDKADAFVAYLEEHYPVEDEDGESEYEVHALDVDPSPEDMFPVDSDE